MLQIDHVGGGKQVLKAAADQRPPVSGPQELPVLQPLPASTA